MTTENGKGPADPKATEDDARRVRDAELRQHQLDVERRNECRRFILGFAKSADERWSTATSMWRRHCVHGSYEHLVGFLADENGGNGFKTPSQFLDYYCFYGGSDREVMDGLVELDEAICRDPFDSSLFEDCLDRAYIYYLQSRGPRILHSAERANVDKAIQAANLTPVEREALEAVLKFRDQAGARDELAYLKLAIDHAGELLRLPKAHDVIMSAILKVNWVVRSNANRHGFKSLRSWVQMIDRLGAAIEEERNEAADIVKYGARMLGMTILQFCEHVLERRCAEKAAAKPKPPNDEPPDPASIPVPSPPAPVNPPAAESAPLPKEPLP